MNSDNEFLGYGQYLKQIRVEKDISLDRVSEITRISRYMLELIENEAEEKLPEDLYVRNFIRLYARAVGIDEKDALSHYGGKTQDPKARYQANKPLPIIDKKLGAYIGSAAVVLLIVVVWIVMSTSSEKGDGLEAVPEVKMQSTESPSVMAEKEKDAPFSDVYKIYDNKKKGIKYILHAKAIEKTWLKVIIDGQSPIEYMLDSREEIALEAANGFDLLIGNAGGIRLELNGKYVNVPGRSGQVASLKLP